MPQQQQPQQQQEAVHHPQQQQQQQQEEAHCCRQQQEELLGTGDAGSMCGRGLDMSARGAVVQGTFTAQELEQQWQLQVRLEHSPTANDQQQQQQQLQGQGQGQLWESEQDMWFEQQIAEQRPWRQELGPVTVNNCTFFMGVDEGGDISGSSGGQFLRRGVEGEAEQGLVLTRAAVDALHDMVHSCMDRSC
jgi:hypothetical protein